MSFFSKNGFLSAIFLISIQACSSHNTNKAEAPDDTAPSAKMDTSILKYDPAKADKRIDDYMQKLHLHAGFNGNVLVAIKGKIVYENAFGWANYPNQDKLTLNSQFELASISKTLTATAILQLMERGKLRLSDSVQRFFPNFPYHGVTIRMLLTHRSGLPNYVYTIDDIFRKEHRDQKKRGYQPADDGFTGPIQAGTV